MIYTSSCNKIVCCLKDSGLTIHHHSSIATVLAEIQQKWGHRALQSARDMNLQQPLLATGIEVLDDLLKGGVPTGRITSLIGTPTSGITTLALHLIAQTQVADQEAIYIDVSQTFNGAYADHCGVDLDRLLVVRPPDALEALELTRDIAYSRVVSLIVIDLNQVQPALPLKRLHQPLSSTRTTLLLLAERTLSHTHCSVQITCLDWLYEDQDVVGCHIEATLKQHPRIPVGTQIRFDLRFKAVDHA